MASNRIDTDPVSIQANRLGQLTAWQQSRLEPQAGRPYGMLFGLVLAGVVLAPLMGFLFWIAWQAFRSASGWSTGWLVGVWLLFMATMTGVGIAALVAPLLRRSRLLRDLAGGSIEQAEGQVVFERTGYVARVNGRLLRDSVGKTEVNLPPGWYRFYVLPLTSRVLSAEALSPLSQGQAAVLDALAQAHRFTFNDLACNRLGQLSARQRGRLARGIVGLLVVLAGLLVLFAWLLATLPADWWLLLVSGLFATVAAYAISKRASDLLAGRVALLEGVVSREESTSDESTTYYYVLAGKRFEVSGAAHGALVEGLRYRLYYTPASEKVVSVEPLP